MKKHTNSLFCECYDCTFGNENRMKTIILAEKQIKLIDYALCFLNANYGEDNEEALEMNEQQVADMVVEIKRKL